MSSAIIPPALPGQTYFAPGVRVIQLEDMPKPGPEKGIREMTELREDILQVVVTRPCTGSAQFQVTLNNWIDSLPGDRPTNARAIAALKAGSQLSSRFKYNDFRILDLGMRIRIDMRYFPNVTTPLALTDKQAQQFVPMISGPISDMQFTFSDRDGARVVIKGEDDLCMLKNKNPAKVDYWARPEKEIVEDVLRRAGFPFPIAKPAIPWPKFTESEGKALAEAHFEGQSFLDYLRRFAERWDFEVFLEYVSLDNPDSGQEFHFEPSRCRRPPDNTLRDIYLVERGKNLIEFNPTLNVVDQCTSVTFTGHDHHWQSSAEISATSPRTPNPLLAFPAPSASPEPLADELHIDSTRNDEPLVSGPEWRRRKFGLNPVTEHNQRGIDAERAQVMAEALYRKRARQFLKVDTVTLGLPRLRAGKHVEYIGMGAPFDGFYYVEESNHTFGDDGLLTHFTSRRPGMAFRSRKLGV